MGKPDYETMERFISAIQKLVIKDVVQFTDRKLDTYKSIVPKDALVDFAFLSFSYFCEISQRAMSIISIP